MRRTTTVWLRPEAALGEDKIKGCLHQNHIFAVRPRASRLLPHFLEALLGSHYAKLYFLRRAKQTTNLASTNKTTIGNLPLLLPSLDEQKFILDELSASTAKLREAIVIAGREIDLISEYRTRLIADVVTGKLDVREAAARLPEEPEAEDLSPAEDVESEAEEFGEDDDDVSA
jgi:type I restriction enzyme S subunit